MKKAVSAILTVSTVFALFCTLCVNTLALTAQLDKLQINSSVFGQSEDLKDAGALTINEGDRIKVRLVNRYNYTEPADVVIKGFDPTSTFKKEIIS